jgi:capsular exopolysaccharide synthesis family protein
VSPENGSKLGQVFDSSALLKTLQGARGDAHPATPNLVPVPPRLELAASEIPRFSDASWLSPQPLDPTTRAVMGDETVAAEEFRLLLAKIRILGEEQPLRCFGVISAMAGEGKTTVAVGLAAALARQAGRRVLLIEGDLRKPSLERYLGLSPERGVGEWLEGSDEPLLLRRLVPPGFVLLSAGQAALDRPELLASRRMAGLLEAARRSFNVVLVDCPPIAPVADSVLLQDLLDGFLFVVRSSVSPREAILRAVSRLRPGRIRGLVLNDQKEILHRYSSYGYRHYGTER